MKKIIIIIIVLILGIGIYWAYSKNILPIKKLKVDIQNGSNVASNTPVQVKINYLPLGEKPNYFPSEIPVESGALMYGNYDAINGLGQKQGTRDFFSKATVEENYNLYKKFFQDNGWKITMDDPKGYNGANIFADKGKNSMNAHIYMHPIQKMTRVVLTNILKD